MLPWDLIGAAVARLAVGVGLRAAITAPAWRAVLATRRASPRSTAAGPVGRRLTGDERGVGRVVVTGEGA